MKTGIVQAGVAAAIVLLTGCEYEAPLTSEHSIAIDRALVGVWGEVPESGKDPAEPQMMILAYSETEYLIHYPIGDDGIYYRGYPVKIGDKACVQLKVIGTEEGPVEKGELQLFHVAKYTLNEGVLEIQLLNSDIVDNDLKTSDALYQAFLENIGEQDLFENPGQFRKLE